MELFDVLNLFNKSDTIYITKETFLEQLNRSNGETQLPILQKEVQKKIILQVKKQICIKEKFNNNIYYTSLYLDNLQKIVGRKMKQLFYNNRENKPINFNLNEEEIFEFISKFEISNNIVFDVMFECNICSPGEGMIITCVVKSVTKAGIRAEIDESPTPLVIFIARDHQYNNPAFSKLNENDSINIKVIGSRFELNDKYVSVIGNLHEGIEKKKKSRPGKKIAIEIMD